MSSEVQKQVLKHLIQCNFLSYILLFFLFVFIVTDRAFDRKTTALFLSMVICLFINTLAECGEFYIQWLEYFSPLRYATSTVTYSFPVLTLVLLIFIIRRNNPNFVEKVNVILLMPFILLFLLEATSFYTKVCFSFDENGGFYRGPLNYLPVVMSIVYAIILLVETYVEFRKNSIREMSIVVAIVVIGIVASILESEFDYHFLVNASMSGGLVFYYLYLHVQVYKRDALTHLLNRRSFYIDQKKYIGKKSVIVAFDLNNLKVINDSFGHDAGDKALVAIADTLTRYKPRGSEVYRMGGDEFTMVCVKRSVEEVNAMLDRIDERLHKTNYTVACGVEEFIPGMSFEEVCKFADQAMYENKRKIKEGMIR